MWQTKSNFLLFVLTVLSSPMQSRHSWRWWWRVFGFGVKQIGRGRAPITQLLLPRGVLLRRIRWRCRSGVACRWKVENVLCVLIRSLQHSVGIRAYLLIPYYNRSFCLNNPLPGDSYLQEQTAVLLINFFKEKFHMKTTFLLKWCTKNTHGLSKPIVLVCYRLLAITRTGQISSFHLINLKWLIFEWVLWLYEWMRPVCYIISLLRQSSLHLAVGLINHSHLVPPSQRSRNIHVAPTGGCVHSLLPALCSLTQGEPKFFFFFSTRTH